MLDWFAAQSATSFVHSGIDNAETQLSAGRTHPVYRNKVSAGHFWWVWIGSRDKKATRFRFPLLRGNLCILPKCRHLDYCMAAVCK